MFNEDDSSRGKAAFTCTAKTVVADCANVVSKPDPLLCELREAMKKQEEKLEILTQRIEQLQMQGERGWRGPRQEPRYDPSGRPICFRCQQAGHIARFCKDAFLRPNQRTNIAISAPVRVAAAQELQRNSLPL